MCLRLFKLLLVLLPLAGAILPGVPADHHAAAQVSSITLADPAGQLPVLPPRQGRPYPPAIEPGGYTASIGATFQAFENGFMTWRADNGVIWVFLENGDLLAFSSEVYGRLPNSALYPPLPAGYSLPVQGFKRVYDNFPDIRAALGWGIGGEIGFLMEYVVDYQGNVFITIAQDIPIKIVYDGTWRYLDSFPPLPTPPQTPAILSFSISPLTINRGETVHLAWNVQNAASVDVYRDARGVPVDLGNYPPVGSMDYTAISSDVYDIPFVVIPVDSLGRQSQTVRQVITVTIRCPYTYFFGSTSLRDVAGTCPQDAAQTVSGAFQPFEGGIMVWRSDTREILVLYPTGQFWPYPDTWIEGQPEAVTATPPAGRAAPVRGFGKVWAFENSGYDATPLRQSLGWATAPEQAYSIQVQTIAFRNRYHSGYTLSLPDGQALHLDTRSRTWQSITP